MGSFRQIEFSEFSGSIKKGWPVDRVERRKVGDLIPYARNARTHSEEQVSQIAASIRKGAGRFRFSSIPTASAGGEAGGIPAMFAKGPVEA